MSRFYRLLIIAMLVYGVISGDIKLNDPVLIPVVIELIKIKERPSKSDEE
ncbi:MAG: hypothetical protein RMX97_30075 [Nostoc sp. DedQUE11]|nr:hypothetical protein [Nostoc sp. DedQUE11]